MMHYWHQMMHYRPRMMHYQPRMMHYQPRMTALHYQPPDDCITGCRMGRLMAVNAAGATWGLIDIRDTQRPNQQLKLASYFAGPSLQGKRHIFKFN